MEALSNQPLVIDNGSGVIKAGFAGGETPKLVFPSYVGRTKHLRMMPGGALEGSETFVGKKVQDHRGLFRIQYAMEHGIVTDWSDMQKIWSHIYSKDNLNINSEDHPVLLTEAPLNPRQNRQRAAEVFFETFNVPAMFISPQAVLSLYASGRTTGVVLDCGDGVTHVVPVYEGFTLPHAITRMDVAGRDVTSNLQLQLRRNGYSFHTSAEMEVVREIKEKFCYVAYNPTKEEQLEEQRVSSSFSSKTGASTSSSAATSAGTGLNEYQLPDGTPLKIGPERFRAPEILFRPEIAGFEYGGVQDCLLTAIEKSDMDLRKTLFSQIVLSGGSTMFKGFGDRLLSELRRKKKDTKIRISAPPSRKYSTWAGGSILASLATFKTMWIRKDEYEEYGASIVHRKTL